MPEELAAGREFEMQRVVDASNTADNFGVQFTVNRNGSRSSATNNQIGDARVEVQPNA